MLGAGRKAGSQFLEAETRDHTANPPGAGRDGVGWSSRAAQPVLRPPPAATRRRLGGQLAAGLGKRGLVPAPPLPCPCSPRRPLSAEHPAPGCRVGQRVRAESRPQSKGSERSDFPVAVASGLVRGWDLSAAASNSGSELREPRAGRGWASPWSPCSRETFAGAGVTGARPRPPTRSSQPPILGCQIQSPAGGFRTARSLTLNRGKQAQRPEKMIEVTVRQRHAWTEGRWGAGTTGWSQDPVGASGEDSTRSLTLCESTVMETQLSPLLGSDFDSPGL